MILDGLFLAVALDRVLEAGWEFDEQYDFHHYDLASCLNAFELGLRLRTVFMPIVHWSVGNQDPADPVFVRNQKTFLKNFRHREIRFGQFAGASKGLASRSNDSIEAI